MRSLVCALALCLSLFGAAAVHAAAKTELSINGSTTVLPIMQKIIEPFMAANPTVEVSLSGGGSGNGIKALIDGQTMLAMSSRDMKDSEIKEAASKNVQAKRIAVAVDAIVPVVHPENPVKDLSIEQLRGLYSGAITNWKEVGGKDAKVVVVSRDTSSGTYESWNEMVMNKEKVMPAALMQASSGAVVQTVSKNKQAIGYVGLGYLNKSTKALTIKGLKATSESALSRAWPLSRELYVFTNGEPKGSLKDFMDYVMHPAKGQKAVLEAGFVPVTK